MDELRQYIFNHVARSACRCGKCVTNGPESLPGHTCDMVFFQVSAVDDPDPAELERLIRANVRGNHCDVDLFDGNEHGYQELGGWIGDQGLALVLMGLGDLLGLWKCLTPLNMLPGIDKELAMQMAGAGYLTIKHDKVTNGGTRTPQTI